MKTFSTAQKKNQQNKKETRRKFTHHSVLQLYDKSELISSQQHIFY